MVSVRLKLHKMPKTVKNHTRQGDLTEGHLTEIAKIQVNLYLSPWLTTHQAWEELAEKDLRKQRLKQYEIGEKIGWSREQVKNHISVLDKIGTEVLKITKEYQEGRVPENGTNVPIFNFTEGWFRSSGLYGLDEIGDKIGWSRDKVSQYIVLLEKIATQILESAKEHQEDRVPENGTSVPFNFTEGWFRSSGLYGLDEIGDNKYPFQQWYELELGWSKPTVNNFMNVAEEFGEKYKIYTFENFEQSALYLLAAPRVPEPARQEAIELAHPVFYEDIITYYRKFPRKNKKVNKGVDFLFR